MLEILEDLGTRKDKSGTSRRWCKARCGYCGNIVEKRTQQIKQFKSCGCATQLKAVIKHGMANTRQYKCWIDIKTRCNNPKNKSFIRYGARGIAYDEKWENFEGFWEDMKDTYFEDGTIERIDNNKGYFKNNCTWVTISEQSKNRNKINTFKKREYETYHRKITPSDLIAYGDEYLNTIHGNKHLVAVKMSEKLNVSLDTAKIYLSKYKKENK